MMKIGIIGTGAIGGTIAQKLVKAGHSVAVANSQGIEGVRAFAESINATPADIHSVGNNADVLILSIPMLAIANLPKSVFTNLADKTIVVDTGNYYPEFRDTPIAEVDNGKPESQWLSEQINRPVIKAFNMVLAYSLMNLGKAKGAENRIAMLVAGDNLADKQLVMQLVDECGFEPVDNGELANSWTQQPNSAGYCCDYTAQELLQVQANSSQTPQSVTQNRKDYIVKYASLFTANSTHQDMINTNRAANR